MDDDKPETEKPKDSEAEPDVCPVHGVKLCIGAVAVIYGYRLFSNEDNQAGELFPLACEESYGGCSIEPDSPDFVDVKYCPVCRSEKAKWRKEGRNARPE